jgi:hypothetical protein
VAGILGGALLVVACAGSKPSIQTGPGAEVTYDGLVRVDNSVMAKVWVRDDIDLSAYNKVLPVVTGVQYRTVKEMSATVARRSNQGEFFIPEDVRKEFETDVVEIFREEFGKSKQFTLTDQPGDDVLLVRAELQDVVSKVPPEGPGREYNYIRSVGDATLVLELYDAGSGEILARAADRREFTTPGDRVERSAPGFNRANVRRGLQYWATILVNALDSLKAKSTG